MSPYGKCRGRAIGSPAYRLANPCHSEDAPMLYEVRTYTLRPGTVAEFEERFAKRLPLREKHSKMGAFWHTEFGPLNQAIHVYPYDDLRQRTSVRAAMAQDTALAQLPGGGDLIAAMESEIMNPAPFTYTYAPGDIPPCSRGGRGRLRRAKSPPRWRPAGRASSAGSASSSTPGCTRISTSAPRFVR